MDLPKEPSVINKLDFPVDAYLKIDGGDKRGAGEPKVGSKGEFKSRVPAKDSLPIYMESRAFQKMLLIVEMDYLPRCDGIEAIKAIPGTRFGPVHHTEFLIEEKKYVVKFHYGTHKKKYLENDDKARDKDPTIIHPNDPGGQG